MAKQPIPLPLPIEEKKCEECPKCPPVGAPAWMATFADMATLLMAFFVLILSFAEFNSPKFKQIAGSLKNSFGVQRETPVVEQPRGTTVIELKFSPNPDPAVKDESKQDTTQTESPNLDTKKADAGDGGRDSEMAEALAEALQNGDVKIKMENNEVVMEFADQKTGQSPEEFAEQLKDAAQALQDVAEKTGQPTDDVKMAGLADKLDEMAKMAEAAGQAQDLQQQLEQLANDLEQQTQENQAAQAKEDAKQRKADLSEAQLQVALRQEIAEGLVEVEQREGKVFITVGSGGAFPSGTADLTDQAKEIMNRIAFSSMTDSGNIKITGHTDDVPIGGGRFRDNWDLAAARSASVVREIANTGLIKPTQLEAVSMGESAPVADNSTAEGREKNRRIEIEINYE